MAEFLSSFYTCVYEVVNDHSLDSIISWGKSNISFIIWNLRVLHSKLLSISRPSRLPYASIKMFFYDLKYYGFKRVEELKEFGNASFVRGKPELLRKMQRKSFDKNLRKYQANVRAEDATARLQHLRI
ncbi:PREDICTED: heat stress transcription factor A-4a-like [Camelina sativa]|uniref:Heat stress transcription factor A-4a-like n=1 Tax=Camelina sativa TaxID=90675 RepID=A0ABM0USG7_CAMSA|nr:PREDICTED: heat stress transcription factor A-4a-like [Camelina sativa]